MRMADRYRRMGFQARIVAPIVPLEMSVARSVHRAFWNARPVCPHLMTSFHREAQEALSKIHEDRHYQCTHLPGGSPPREASDEAVAFVAATTTIERLLEEGSLDDHPTADAITRFYALAGEECDTTGGGGLPVRRLWSAWRGTLARRTRPVDRTGSGMGGRGGVQAPRWSRGHEAALTEGPIAQEPVDYERVMDAYEELQGLLQAGIAQEAIREALKSRVRAGLASLARSAWQGLSVAHGEELTAHRRGGRASLRPYCVGLMAVTGP